MRDKIVKETMKLYEMLGANSQQKSAKGRRGVVNEVQMSNHMTEQLTVVTRQVSSLIK